jgi:hypothetical protein
MSKILDIISYKKMALISSLPENNYELAKACWENGADVIKMHINVSHRASKNTFKSLEEEKDVLIKILNDSPIPVGIVAGQNTSVAENEIEEIIKMGFDFISLYGDHCPTSLIINKDITLMTAINYNYTLEEIKVIGNKDFGSILELSICHPDTYGERLNVHDLAKYSLYTNSVKVPTVVPTQRLILPNDVKLLHKIGVKYIMVGAISMGKTIDSISENTKKFATAIREL